MKPEYFYIKTLCAVASTFLGAVLMPGCIKEDRTKCGISVSFKYDKNIDYVNKFDSNVSYIELYLFDGKGNFYESHTRRASVVVPGSTYFEEDYEINLSHIPPGSYTLVAWCNRSNNLSLSPISKVPTPFSSCTLSLNCETLNRAPREAFSLFHGHMPTVIVEEGYVGTKKVTMDLTNFTNYITVIKKGLPVGTGTNPGYECYITSKNGSYRFDGEYANNTVVTYPAYDVEVGTDGLTLTSHFYILRERNNGSSGSELVVTYLVVAGDPTSRKEIKFDLSEMLIEIAGDDLNKRNTSELDRDQDYVIELTFDITNGTVTIKINGWETQTQIVRPL